MKKLLMLISLCLAAAMILPVCAFAADGDAALPFRDVGAGEWYYGNVKYVYENGIMKGTSDTEFSPEGTLTRAMCVTVLHRVAGEPEADGALKFTDVKAGEYYEKAVVWASQNGIVMGRSENEFVPDGTITRAEFATMLYRYLESAGKKLSETRTGSTTDYSKIPEYAKIPVSVMYRSCVINGRPGGVFDPDASVTRAETAAMTERFEKLSYSGSDVARGFDLVTALHLADSGPATVVWGDYSMTDSRFPNADEGYFESVRWAIEKGFVVLTRKSGGYVKLGFTRDKRDISDLGELTFEADRKLMKGDAVITLYHHAEKKLYNYTKRADITGAADYAGLTDEKWLASDPINGTGFFNAVTGENGVMTISDYMSWAVGVGIVEPDGSGRLDPFEVLTHAELDSMIERYAKLQKLYDLNDTLKLSFEASSGQKIPYRLYVPEDYDENEKYPVVLYLHGAGYVGSANEAQLKECANVFANPNSPVYGSIFIIPQCPEGFSWNSAVIRDATSELLEFINQTYSTDRSRQYVTGVSLGGMGTWAMLRYHPEQFSAAIPVASPVAFQMVSGSEPDIYVPDPSYYDEEYVKANDREFRISPEMFEIPIRNVYDADDELLGDMTDYFDLIEKVMNKHGAVDYENVRTDGFGHGGICHQYVDRFDYSLMEWMFSQRRETGIKP